MLEKTLRMNYLFDFYQSLLTEKQRKYMSLYYLDDYSLGEIAETYDVSRQAVFDNIRRTEALLEQYEEKLSLLQKFEQRSQLLTELKAAALDKVASEQLMELIEALEKLE